jgi:hypothetical protein
MQKYAKKYVCKKCDYTCTRKFLWNQHIVTGKHRMLTNVDKMLTKNMHICCCGKAYKHRQSLHVHKKKCPSIVVKHAKDKKEDEKEIAIILKTILQENRELKKEMKNLKINQTINHNNQNYNINVFLNEHCKNAMCLDDFINQIQLTLTDIVKTKQLGFAGGVSNILIKNLNELPSVQRPIHCSDTKRLKFYVKDEKGWNIDKCNKKVDTAIESIIQKQMKELRKWEVNNPDYLENDKKLKAWQLMIRSIMGSSCDTEKDRDGKNIMKNVGDNTALKDAMSNTRKHI